MSALNDEVLVITPRRLKAHTGLWPGGNQAQQSQGVGFPPLRVQTREFAVYVVQGGR